MLATQSDDGSVLGDIEQLQRPTDTILTVANSRQRVAKDLHYLHHNAIKVIWPISKLIVIEVNESAEEEKIIGFVRD